MRIMRFALLLMILAFTCTYARSQAPRGELTISISTDTPTVTSGANVWVNIVMKNTSDRKLSCMSAYTNNHVDVSFLYQVAGPSGKPAGKRKPKHPVLARAGSIYPCMFGPGQTTRPVRSLISSIFDMTRPGKYIVRVSRRTTQHTWVHSNLIHITVTP